MVRSLGFAAAGFLAAALTLPALCQEVKKGPNGSAILPWKEARLTEHPWGQMRALFMGETHGTKNLFSAYMTVKPGQAVHKAHRHAEEEYMVLVEGAGTWHLDGKEVPAEKGDVVYTAPWSVHGLVNTGEKDLTFFVVKSGSKGVAAPPKPAGSDGD